MSFQQKFCSSPWFHMRIDNSGDFHYCRWANDKKQSSDANISNSFPITWFQEKMSSIRQSMLDGDRIDSCAPCHIMEKHGKISGRQRQLLKVGVTVQDFEKSLLSSPWLEEFKKSSDSDGDTDQLPQDWQIDLGNYCNSACIFCSPDQSSRLALEFKKLKLIDQLPPRSWCDDPLNVEKFIDTLRKTPKLAYLHFIGGETLITPGFRKILQGLIDQGINDAVSLGFTTNLTTWDPEIVDMLLRFKEVNLGMSVECIHPLNDYVRYGSSIKEVCEIMEKWIEVGKRQQWPIQLRVTPTVLSIYYLDTIYEYAIKHSLNVESCNFLENPIFMKPSTLPMQHRKIVIQRLNGFLDRHRLPTQEKIINTRHLGWTHQQVMQDAESYINYLINEPDQSHLLPDLVDFVKLIESNRKNSILNYLPEYEDLLRSAGY